MAVPYWKVYKNKYKYRLAIEMIAQKYFKCLQNVCAHHFSSENGFNGRIDARCVSRGRNSEIPGPVSGERVEAKKTWMKMALAIVDCIQIPMPSEFNGIDSNTVLLYLSLAWSRRWKVV